MDGNKAAVRQVPDAARDLANIAYGRMAAHFHLATYGALLGKTLGGTKAAKSRAD